MTNNIRLASRVRDALVESCSPRLALTKFNEAASDVVDELTGAGYIIADRHDLTEAFWAVVNSHTGNGKRAPNVAEIIGGVIDRFPGGDTLTKAERRARRLDTVTTNSIAHVKRLTAELHEAREHFNKRIERLARQEKNDGGKSMRDEINEISERITEQPVQRGGMKFASHDALREAEELSALRTQRTPSNRTITIDIETGHWVTGHPLRADESARIASSVMPGWPADEIARAYGDWMSADPDADPEPGSFAGRIHSRIADVENQLEGLRERVDAGCGEVVNVTTTVRMDEPTPKLHWVTGEDGTIRDIRDIRDIGLTGSGHVVTMPRVVPTGEKRTVETAEMPVAFTAEDVRLVMGEHRRNTANVWRGLERCTCDQTQTYTSNEYDQHNDEHDQHVADEVAKAMEGKTR